MRAYAMVTVKVEEAVYLLSDAKGTVNGFESATDALNHFERMYGRAQGRGYEGGMSACIHFCTFDIRCHDPVEPQSLMPSIVEPGASIRSVGGIAGRITGIHCTGPEAGAWHESGHKPRLVVEAGA